MGATQTNILKLLYIYATAPLATAADDDGLDRPACNPRLADRPGERSGAIDSVTEQSGRKKKCTTALTQACDGLKLLTTARTGCESMTRKHMLGSNNFDINYNRNFGEQGSLFHALQFNPTQKVASPLYNSSQACAPLGAQTNACVYSQLSSLIQPQMAVDVGRGKDLTPLEAVSSSSIPMQVPTNRYDELRSSPVGHQNYFAQANSLLMRAKFALLLESLRFPPPPPAPVQPQPVDYHSPTPFGIDKPVERNSQLFYQSVREHSNQIAPTLAFSKPEQMQMTIVPESGGDLSVNSSSYGKHSNL